jgi:hypothetical protein
MPKYIDPRKKKNPNETRGNPALKKGVVLNPKGRPKGSLNKYTLLAREMMTEQGPKIVEKVIEKAMDGDVHCLKMCMDRILPVQKAIDPNKAKQQSQVIINVGASDTIKQKIKSVDAERLVEPEEKDDDELIIEVSESVNG